MDLIAHIIEHAFEDTLPLVPFLFLTYLALEALEHMAGVRVNAAVKRAGAAGPVVGALLGIVPQCGFSAMAATLYAGRVITLGTLVAVFLSISDEMLPLLVAGHVEGGFLVQVLAAKAIVASVAGLGVDALLRLLRRNARVHALLRGRVLGTPQGAEAGSADAVPADGGRPCGDARRGSNELDLIDELSQAGEGADYIHRLCERDHCGCDDVADMARAGREYEQEADRARDQDAVASAVADGGHQHARSHGDELEHGEPRASHGLSHGHDHGHDHEHSHTRSGSIPVVLSIVKSALIHTAQITVFIYLVTVVLVALLETVGEPALEAFLRGNEVLAIFAAALVGLIPNCAASVVVTQLYLEGVLPLGAMFAGTLAGAGAGFLVLFRTNRSVRENVVILCILYVVAVICGFAAMGV